MCEGDKIQNTTDPYMKRICEIGETWTDASEFEYACVGDDVSSLATLEDVWDLEFRTIDAFLISACGDKDQIDSLKVGEIWILESGEIETKDNSRLLWGIFRTPRCRNYPYSNTDGGCYNTRYLRWCDVCFSPFIHSSTHISFNVHYIQYTHTHT